VREPPEDDFEPDFADDRLEAVLVVDFDDERLAVFFADFFAGDFLAAVVVDDFFAGDFLELDLAVDFEDDEPDEEPEPSLLARTRRTTSAVAAMAAVATPRRFSVFGPRRFFATLPILGALSGSTDATFLTPSGTFFAAFLGSLAAPFTREPDVRRTAPAAVPNAEPTAAAVRPAASCIFVDMSSPPSPRGGHLFFRIFPFGWPLNPPTGR